MQNILVIGAGLSSYYLIDYLAVNSQKYNWSLRVADTSLAAVQAKIQAYSWVEGLSLDILNPEVSNPIIAWADVVVSLVPAFLQPKIAEYCLRLRKHLLTASYLPAEIKAMEAEVKAHNLLFINELGLDPGIDHLSAKQMIDHLQQQGAAIKSFKSYTGALIAPESDNNPWHYKFTWNPRNVVLAGQGSPAKYLENQKYRYIPYNQLFKQIDHLHIEDGGDFEGYANRDSLGYRQVYGLDNVPTILRGTLRQKGYCEAWSVLVDLGLTDNSVVLENSEKMTYREFMEAFVHAQGKDLKTALARQVHLAVDSEALAKIEWLGLFENRVIGLLQATPAQILQQILEEKWRLGAEDCDMIVMQHQIVYELAGKNQMLIADLVVKGEDAQHTAIAKTVGLPLAIATKLLLTQQIHLSGVVIPVLPMLYQPILAELQTFGIVFKERILAEGAM
ncbi:MAG: saccharopine dehydrogenase NADP-binding domain-containing protein [Microscillaceae bacterium]|jgi:saccharopine dehydrogenase (NADP+, L-glutamate forming)|nr:saccharopine dehydrogenase NADP-binding domain-containing protein [Microscillaceae bacterium]